MLSDASAGALRSTLSTTIDTHKRAPKGTQTTGEAHKHTLLCIAHYRYQGSKSYSSRCFVAVNNPYSHDTMIEIVKEGIKNSAHVTQTRPSPTLLKGMSDSEYLAFYDHSPQY